MIAQLVAVLAGGFLGSAHCIGMCGGFAAAIGTTDRPFWPIFARQLVYNLGRVFTYAFLGCLAGASGLYLSQFHLGPINPQQAFSMLAGVIMLFIGLSTLGVLRLPNRIDAGLKQLLAPLFAYFLNARGWWGYFSAGLANGFLPCGLVYSFLALAATQSGPVSGMALMISFGLGTIPAMLLVGCGSSALKLSMRMHIQRLAAVLVVAFGLLTVWRGLPSRKGACCQPGSSQHDSLLLDRRLQGIASL
jgi:sulfite exporter TauE/SafE